jgi:hypothetical protein
MTFISKSRRSPGSHWHPRSPRFAEIWIALFAPTRLVAYQFPWRRQTAFASAWRPVCSPPRRPRAGLAGGQSLLPKDQGEDQRGLSLSAREGDILRLIAEGRASRAASGCTARSSMRRAAAPAPAASTATITAAPGPARCRSTTLRASGACSGAPASRSEK